MVFISITPLHTHGRFSPDQSRIDLRQKNLHNPRIELAPRLCPQLRSCLFQAQRRAMRTGVGYGIPRIGDCHNAGIKGNLAAHEAPRVAAAIKAFVM